MAPVSSWNYWYKQHLGWTVSTLHVEEARLKSLHTTVSSLWHSVKHIYGNRSVVTRNQKWEETIYEEAGGDFSENTPYLHDGSDYLTIFTKSTQNCNWGWWTPWHISYTSSILFLKDFFIFISVYVCVWVCIPTWVYVQHVRARTRVTSWLGTVSCGC